MITVDIDVLKTLNEWAAAVDLTLTLKLLATVCPLIAAFLIIADTTGGKRRVCFFGLEAVYFLVAGGFFALAFGDATGEKKTFYDIFGAIAASAGLFLYFSFTHFALYLARRPLENRKKYVAKISEIPAEYSGEKKIYPLSSNIFPSATAKKDANIAEFDKFLQKIRVEELSFPDKIEYNRICRKADLLRGVAITDKTSEDFCALFLDSVKLCAKYGVE